MEFIFLLKALKKRLWVIALCVLIAVAAAFILTMNEKKVYKSIAQIATGFTTGGEVLMENRFNPAEIEAKFNNLIENFNSPTLLNRLSYNILLHDLTVQPFAGAQQQDGAAPKSPLSKEEMVRILNAKLYGLDSQPIDEQKEGQLYQYLVQRGYDVGSIKSGLSVSRVPKTDFVYIVFKSSDPNLSAYAVNNLVTEFETFYNQTRRSLSDTSIATLDSLVRVRKSELDGKIAAKTAFMTNRRIVDVGMEGSSALGQIGSLQSQLAQEKGNRENLTYRIQELKRLIAAASGGTTTSSTSRDNLEYIALRNQYKQLYSEYVLKGSNDPAMKRRLDNINVQMQKLRPTGENTSTAANPLYVEDLQQKKLDAEGELKSTNQKISSIQTMLNQLNGSMSTMASGGAGLEQLEREIQLASAEYTNARESYLRAMNTTEIGVSKFKQTMVGQPAQEPEPTYRGLKVGLAGGSAMVLSALVILFLAFIDQSIKSPSYFQRLTHLPLVGTINHIPIKPNALEEVANFDKTDSRRDQKTNTTFRELLRKVRYEIEHSGGKQIFLFTSTEPQQGKTTLIQALAYSLSLVKKKVLIIDTNFCNNDLTQLLSAKPALEKFYVNGKPFSIEDVQAIVTKTHIPGVDMIGCQGGNYTPREILPQNHLLHYLKELTKVYDFIFLEGAPLNDFTDTKELIHYSDGVIAVFSSEASLTAMDKESINFFKQNKEKFIGAILNKVREENLDS